MRALHRWGRNSLPAAGNRGAAGDVDSFAEERGRRRQGNGAGRSVSRAGRSDVGTDLWTGAPTLFRRDLT